MAETSNDSAEISVKQFLSGSEDFDPKSVPDALAMIETYSTRLCFLWEQYIKVVHLNVILAGATIGLIANMTFLSEDMEKLKYLDLLQISLAFAGLSGFAALVWRFCAQVMMERQVYGNIRLARWYFKMNGSAEPQAVRSIWGYQFGTGCLKWVSGPALLISWILLFTFATKNISTYIQ